MGSIPLSGHMVDMCTSKYRSRGEEIRKSNSWKGHRSEYWFNNVNICAGTYLCVPWLCAFSDS